PLQRLPGGPLGRVPRCAFPAGPDRAGRGVLHAGRVEGGAPALLVIAGELEVVALAGHPDRDPADTGPGIEPGAQTMEPEPAVIGRHRKAGEAEGGEEEAAALVEHGDTLSGSRR